MYVFPGGWVGFGEGGIFMVGSISVLRKAHGEGGAFGVELS